MANIGFYPLNQIITGDSRLLAPSIPDESVDLIFTDPVYENIQDYAWLAETAARILKPNSACLVWTSTKLISQCGMALVNGGLSIRWYLVAAIPSGFPSRFYGKIFGNYMMCIYAEKGNSQPKKHLSDIIYTKASDKFTYHQWSKSLDPFFKWIECFSNPDDLVYDPFAGGGATPAACKMMERNFIASEINPETAINARNRLLQTKVPLGLGRSLTPLALDVCHSCGTTYAIRALYCHNCGTRR
jgi:DNA modification methylase